MTKVINFYAGPGAGKSTNAAGLFYEMKKANISVELVTEYAKELVWEGSTDLLKNQLHVLAEQYRRQFRLVGQVDYIITDSPLPLSITYASTEDSGVIYDIVSEYYYRLENINVFVVRTKPYVVKGRMQTLEQARVIDEEIKRGLTLWGGIDYTIESTGDVNNLMTTILKGATND